LHAGGFTSNLDEINNPKGIKHSMPRIHCYVHLKYTDKATAATNKQNGYYWSAPGNEDNQYWNPQIQEHPFNREMLFPEKWSDTT
jgi:hypothetical protein